MLNSFYGQFFVAMQAYLKTAVPELRWIDQDFGQLEIEADRPPVDFPCLLIDFSGSQFTQELMEVEMAESCMIQTRLAFAPYSNTNQLTPTDSREKALQYYEIENKVYRALKGWYATATDGNSDEYAICQPLNRMSDKTETRNDSLRVRALVWATSYEDYTANTTLKSIAPELVINEEINEAHPEGVGYDIIEDTQIVYPEDSGILS